MSYLSNPINFLNNPNKTNTPPPEQTIPAIPAAIEAIQQQSNVLVPKASSSNRLAQAIGIMPIALKLLKFIVFIGIAVGIVFLIANFVAFPPMLFVAIALITFVTLYSIHLILNQCLKRREKRFQEEMAIQIFKALRSFTTERFKDSTTADQAITALKIEPKWKGIPEFNELMGLLLSKRNSLSDLKRYNELYRSIFNANIANWDTGSDPKNLSEFQKFFQKLGRVQELDVDGSPVFEKLGSEMLGTFTTPTKMQEFSDLFKKMFKHPPIGTFHKDGCLKLRGIWWSLFHPKQLCKSLQSKLLGVHHDQSFLCGLSSRVLKIGKVWIMRADGIFNPQKQMTFIELKTDPNTHMHIHNLQSLTKAEEARREQWDKNVPNGINLTTSSTSVNGSAWKSKEAHGSSAAEYLEWYKGEKPKNVNSNIWDLAILKAKKAFASVIPNTKSSRQMLQFGVQTFVTKLERENEDLAVPNGGEGFYLSPCVQMVDRGATIETMTAILSLLEEGALFNDQKIKSLAGLLMSGILLEGRAPNKERYQPLLDMLDFMAKNPEAFQKQNPAPPLSAEDQ